ncbi:winged helix-turn-helix domain-containing protein [Variovorax sp. ZT4R33]|uniref:winged helix-turn-helix domain-containing protein n=1 Tax=Variovorax sp. ZT4R33 TaxID=3443743 RepID=UPI003F4681A0
MIDTKFLDMWKYSAQPLQAMMSFQAPKQALVIAEGPAAFDPIARACRLGGFDVRRVSDLRDANRQLATQLPSVVVLDTVVLGVDVLDWISYLRESPRTAGIPIVITSPSKSADAAVEALDGGADDYVPRPGSHEELLARIKAVVRCRKPELGSDEIVFGPLIIRPTDREVLAAVGETRKKVELGPTEFRLLHFLAVHPETVHTRESLLRRLWPAQHDTLERTIDAHVRGLRRALERAGLPPLVETVLRLGYRLTSTLPQPALRRLRPEAASAQ